jgi:outer membrane protein assembly factor BamA
MAALFVSVLTTTIINPPKNPDNLIIDFEGNTFFSSEFLLATYTPFKKSGDIQKFIKRILDQYCSAGFAFCSIRPEIVAADTINTKLILHIEEGERIIIKDYLFKTNGKTESAPLRRIAHIQKDRYFSLNNLNQTKSAILKTNVFSNISESIMKKGEDYFLYFDLEEKSSDYVMATGSFAEEKSYFTIDFYSLNIFGTLRQFQFRYESNITEGDNKRLFNTNFTEPVLLYPVKFNGELSLWTYDSARLTELNGRFIAPLNNYINVMLSSGIEMVDYLSDTINYDYKNAIVGVGIQTGYQWNILSIVNSITIDYLFRKNERLRIKYDGIVKCADLFVKPHYYFVRTELFEYFDYIRLGGARNLRGYMEDEFRNEKSWWINLEYKALPVYPFIDIAWLDNYYTYSYGAGIEAQTNFANASIVFAWPKKGKWIDGKVHLLIEKGF